MAVFMSPPGQLSRWAHHASPSVCLSVCTISVAFVHNSMCFTRNKLKGYSGPSRHGPDFHQPPSQITIDSPDFHPRRSQKCLLGGFIKHRFKGFHKTHLKFRSGLGKSFSVTAIYDKYETIGQWCIIPPDSAS